MSKANSNSLPYANAASIVRANQKDAYFESSLRSHLQEVLNIFKGQRFINTYPEEITVASKSVYLALTTLLGYRTLGEEYVDLMYVTRNGKRLPKFAIRLGFIVSYAIVPYIVSRIARKFKSKDSEDEQSGVKKWLIDFFTNYTSMLEALMNFHIAVFYFSGRFYSVSKRLFGMRYVFGHNKDPKKIQNNANYSLLGVIILLQFAVKVLIKFKAYADSTTLEEDETQQADASKFSKLAQLQHIKYESIDLSDPKQLPYIPEASRSCMLCLSPMVDPSTANCGHMFCWECIVDWIREHPECPLCRQSCLEQNLLPLR